MKRRLLSAAIALMLSFAFAQTAVADPSQCACYCRLPPDYNIKLCAGETKNLGPFPAAAGCSGDADQNTCMTICNNSHYLPLRSGGGVLIGSTANYDDFCDANADTTTEPPCAGKDSLKNPSGAGCKTYANYCFCKHPSSFATKDCIGKTFNLQLFAAGPASPDASAQCDDYCKATGNDPGAGITPDYNSGICDFVVQDGQCVLNPVQTNASCKSAAQSAAATKAANVAATKIGSPVSLSLPLGDISPAALIGRVINNILGVIGSLAFLMFVVGGIMWMTARGNDKQIAQGKATVVWAALGILAIFSAYGILNLVINALLKS